MYIDVLEHYNISLFFLVFDDLKFLRFLRKCTSCVSRKNCKVSKRFVELQNAEEETVTRDAAENVHLENSLVSYIRIFAP